jgi:hypothetical protein
MPTLIEYLGSEKEGFVGAAIAHVQKQVRRETRLPTEAEIDGSWTFWVKYAPNGNTVDYEFVIWVGENNAVSFGPKTFPRTATPATYDPTLNLYTTTILGKEFSYSTEPVSRVGNQYFDPAVFAFQFPEGSAAATELNFRGYDSAGGEIANGGGLLSDGKNLMAISYNPLIVRFVFSFKPIGGGADFTFEVIL